MRACQQLATKRSNEIFILLSGEKKRKKKKSLAGAKTLFLPDEKEEHLKK